MDRVLSNNIPKADRINLSYYPLLKRSILFGIIAGTIVLSIESSILLGFSVFLILVILGLTWERDKPPILPFCFLYQWFFIVTGYTFLLNIGYYPGDIFVGNIEGAVLVSLIGLLSIAIGLRVLRSLSEKFNIKRSFSKMRFSDLNISLLFWIVIVTNLVDYFLTIVPGHISYTSSQLISNFLYFRMVLFFLLLIEVFRQGRGYRYAVLAIGFVILPQFTSMMSHFKEIIFMVIIAAASQWKPWSRDIRVRRKNNRIVFISIFLVVSLVFMALFWQGGIKPIWRKAYRQGEIQGSPMEKLDQFKNVVSDASANIKFRDNLESLSSRLSSGVGYFSIVLERVPSIIPYEQGFMLKRALEHISKPRFLFPSKKALQTADSWIIRKYAGIHVSGEELNTSIGLTYIAQFYIDFGVLGVISMCFILGFFVGVLLLLLQFATNSYNLYISAVVIMLLRNFTGYESELAKMLGGIIMNTVVFAIILFLIGNKLHRKLLIKNNRKKIIQSEAYA